MPTMFFFLVVLLVVVVPAAGVPSSFGDTYNIICCWLVVLARLV